MSKLQPNKATLWIYILELAAGRYYVGKSEDPEKRYEDHVAGTGAAWTSKYKPIRIGSVFLATGPTHEDATVKELMAVHGIDMVRGGSYSNVVLTQMQIDALTAELRGATDKCMRCGRSGHWIKDCYAKRDAAGEFIRDLESKHPAKTKAAPKSAPPAAPKPEPASKPSDFWGIIRAAITDAVNETDDESSSDTSEYEEEEVADVKKSRTCFRCGRIGHYAPKCYASWHVDGGRIAK